MNTFRNTILLLSVLTVISGCFDQTNRQSSKISKNDPFKNTIVESQFYDVEIDKPVVVEGNKGTRIVILEGSLLDKSGNVVSGSVEVELAEAYSLTEMLMSNLTTTSNGKLLETDGMIYLNFHQNGEELKVNPEQPVYIEMPTDERKEGMQVYTGQRDQEGNMNWVDPKPLVTFLIEVELEQLDFIPDGFSEKVESGLPFKNHQTWSKHLEDSLFYSLASSNIESSSSAYKHAVSGRENDRTTHTYVPAFDSASVDQGEEPACGINPASIKVLKSPQYQQTFIATREFEKRLQSIYESCDNRVLNIYISNLDKDLWYCDSLAASIISKEDIKSIFSRYQSERLTNVRNGAKYAAALQGFFEEEFQKVLNKLNSAKDSLSAAIESEVQDEEKILKEYSGLSEEREKQTMESYGFVRSETGWINIDRGTGEKDWEMMDLEVLVNQGSSFDRAHVYVIIPNRKSLHGLYTENQEEFTVRINGANTLPMPKSGEAICIGVAFIKNQPFLKIERFPIGTKKTMEISLNEIEPSEMADMFDQLGEFNRENNITYDLDYQRKLHEIQERRKEREKEANFILALKGYHYSCCYKDGETLFALNCTPCHNSEPFDFSVYDYRTTEVGIYPYPLGGIKSIHDEEWFILFNQNPWAFAKKNEKAKEIIDVFSPGYGVHTAAAMNREELSIVYEYLGELSEE